MYRNILQRSPSITNASIFIIDDSDVSRTVIEKFFNAEGFNNISFAANGKEALKKIESVQPDIIIADIFMPEMNGYDFLEKVRANSDFDHVPIIVQTSSTDTKEISKAFEFGASDVISKPVEKHQLMARTAFHIENVMFRKRIEKELEAARELQLSMLPCANTIATAEKKYNIQIASHFTPSSELGGDFWGFKKISHGEFGIFTVDITGHGVAAALNTFRVQSILNDPNNFFSSTSIFLKKLNKRIVGLMPIGQYATMFYGVINFNENYIQYSSAASPGGLVVRRTGEVEQLKASGFPLGVEESAEYDLFEAKFNQGDFIVLFSDALIESANKKGDFLSQEEIFKTLSKSKDGSAKDMMYDLVERFKQHVGNVPVDDDLTINIYKRL